MNCFAKKLIELRKQKGYSQEELAEKLYVSRQAVSKWENQKNLPSIDLVYKISEIFEVSIEELIDNKNMREISLVNNNAIIIQNRKIKL